MNAQPPASKPPMAALPPTAAETQERVSRSTPAEYPDNALVKDREGRDWLYSEPNDVWRYLQPTGELAHHSVRSWQKLLHDFGPLIGNGAR